MSLDKIIKVIEYEDTSKDALEKDVIVKSTSSIIPGIFAMILTLFNISRHFTLMSVITGITAIVLIILGIISRITKKVRSITKVFVLISVITYTYFALSWANEGFAILWIQS